MSVIRTKNQASDMPRRAPAYLNDQSPTRVVCATSCNVRHVAGVRERGARGHRSNRSPARARSTCNTRHVLFPLLCNPVPAHRGPFDGCGLDHARLRGVRPARMGFPTCSWPRTTVTPRSLACATWRVAEEALRLLGRRCVHGLAAASRGDERDASPSTGRAGARPGRSRKS